MITIIPAAGDVQSQVDLTIWKAEHFKNSKVKIQKFKNIVVPLNTTTNIAVFVIKGEIIVFLKT